MLKMPRRYNKKILSGKEAINQIMNRITGSKQREEYKEKG